MFFFSNVNSNKFKELYLEHGEGKSKRGMQSVVDGDFLEDHMSSFIS